MKAQSYNISQYLLHRLHELGSKHAFGVCGDVVLGFMNQIAKSPVTQINCCNELNAGYAADGYARLHGLGTVVTTYTVGSLSAINAIGGAFAEHVPVVMISGAPERRHALASRMLHHTLGPDYSVAREMFRKITVACEYLDDPSQVPQQIDEALVKCLFYKKPIFFELPADLVVHPCERPGKFVYLEKVSNSETLQEAQQEICSLLMAAKKPVLLLGFEVIRHGLQDQVKALVEKTGYPFCVFPTAKSVLPENHPQFVGIYQGSWSRDEVRKVLEESNLVLMLGGFFIDSDTGGFTAKLDKNRLIQANFEQVQVKHHQYQEVLLGELIHKLIAHLPNGKKPASLISAEEALKNQEEKNGKSNTKLTVKHFFKRIASFLRPEDIVVADVGDCLYSTSAMLFPPNVSYVTQSFYNSIGYSVGATLGASTSQKRRVLLFVGDGSFQIGAQEVATMIHYGCKPIIFLLNNDGYGIERAIYDGPFNDISSWSYHLLPQVYGGQPGLLVETEEQLEKALETAEKNNELTFIEVKVDKFDFGDILRKAGGAMAEGSKNSYD